MKTTLIGSLAALALTALPGTALAGTDSGFYVGFGIGEASVEDIENFDFDGDDTAWKLFGGYNFGWIPFIDLAVEGGYVDFGKPDDGGIRVDADGFDLFGLVGTNIGPIGVFGKVGLIRWDADTNVGPSDDGTDAAYGIGARFSLFSFQIRAEYEIFDVDAADDVDLLSISGVYTF